METKRNLARLRPALWGMLLFILAQVLILVLVARIDPFLAENNIYVPSQPPGDITIWPGEVTLPSGEVIVTSPYSSLGPILIYFFGVAAVIGLVLAVVPLSVLGILLRLTFALVFGWGAFILSVFWVPLWLAIAIGAAVSLIWFFFPRIWFHNAALIVAFVSLGAVFGRFITPWTAMIVVGAIAVYDVIAVRSGFMVWMADKLSGTYALPALIIPRQAGEWGASLRQTGIQKIAQTKVAERKFSILGGGDISFPCLLTASVYFSQGQGLPPAILMAAAVTMGLAATYLIHVFILKGKPMPALPPIAVFGLAGLLIVQAVF